MLASIGLMKGPYGLVNRDFDSSFKKLLRDSTTTLLTKSTKTNDYLFKVKIGISPKLMNGVFEFAGVHFNLKNQSKCM